MTAYYYLANDIDCSGFGNFEPIGTSWSNPFNGTFDGKGYKITNLYINRSSTDCVGLFGRTGSGSKITNVGLEEVNVNGSNEVGGLAGYNEGETIENCYYDTNTSGCSDTGKGEPKTTVEMKQQATFENWDFTNIWGIVEHVTYPYLQWQVKITSFTPPSPVNDTVCTWRTFNVTVNREANVSWYLNGTLLHTNESTKEANYTLHAQFVGENNVSAIAENANGTDMQEWIWNVTRLTSVTIPTATGTGSVTITTSSGYFCDETAALNASDFPGLPDSAVTFHHGFFNLTICGLDTSTAENVTINFTFPTPIPTNAEFWKYNSSNGTWYSYPFDSNDGDNVISITITDNGAGDHNPALGVINDPNGVGWGAGAAQVPALTPTGLLALIGILGVVLGVATSKRKKK